MREGQFSGAVANFLEVRERRSNFSLESWAIRPSAVDEARREAVLRGEDNAWTPDLGVSSNSLR